MASSGRQPRLHWHELRLPGTHIQANPALLHRENKELGDLVQKVALHSLHGYPEWDKIESHIEVNQFYLGPEESVITGRIERHFWQRVRLYYQLMPYYAFPAWERRRQKRLERPRRLFAWIGPGTDGGLSMYLQRPLRWKGGQYLAVFRS